MSEAIICDELVELVADMLCVRAYKSEIKKVVTAVNGGKTASRSTIELLMSRAREYNRKRLDTTKQEEESKAVGLYEHVIRETSSQDVQLKAQEAINAMLGLGAKFGEGVKDPQEQARDIRETLHAMREATEVDEPKDANSKEPEDS